MPLLTATISGAITQPDLGPGAVTAWIEATSDGSRLTYPGQVIQGRNKVDIDANGNATITLPQLPQTSMTPAEAVWRLVWHPSAGEPVFFEFQLTGNTTWDALVDVSGVPITSSLVAQAEAARDAAVAAAASVATSTWQATTSYVSGQVVQAPDGTQIKSNSSRTSRASFDSTEKGNWSEQYVKAATPTAHAPGLGLYFPEAAGAVGDGTTNDTSAITAAISAMAAGGSLVFGAGKSYKVTSSVTFNKSGRIVGNGATLVVVSGTTSYATMTAVSADNVTIQDLTFSDTSGVITSYLVSNTANGTRIEGCTFTNPNAVCVRNGGTLLTGTRILRNKFLGVWTAIMFDGPHADVWVSENRIDGWALRGIYFVGTSSGAASRVRILGNTIVNMNAGGSVRYPIQTAKSTSPSNFSDFVISGNTIVGPNKAYTATDPGTADQMGLFAHTRLTVTGNTSSNGGDMGITVDSSDTVTITGNTCTNNDTGGICVSGSSTNVSVSGNTCTNNGQNRHADRSAFARTGVYLTSCTNVAVSGNALGDNQGTKTQQYGVTMTSCTNVSLGPDADGGNALATYFKNGAGNSSIVKVTTAAF